MCDYAHMHYCTITILQFSVSLQETHNYTLVQYLLIFLAHLHIIFLKDLPLLSCSVEYNTQNDTVSTTTWTTLD